MRDIVLIAKREFLEQIRGRAFKFSTVLLPLVIGVLIGVGYLAGRAPDVGKHVAIASDSVPLADAIRSQMLDDKDAKFTVDVVAPASAADRAALLALVQNKSINGLLSISMSAGTTTATYTSQAAGDFVTADRLKFALNQGLLNQRLIAKGLSTAEADALLKKVSIETLQIDKQGATAKSNGSAAFAKAFTLAFLLTMPILLYGLDMARSVIEEKSSRSSR